MTGVDITLQSTQTKNNEFKTIPIVNMVQYNCASIIGLAELSVNMPNDRWLIDSTVEASKDMSCEIDDLRDELRAELAKAKEFIKTKYPVRYRLNLLKVLVRRPVTSIIGLILVGMRKLKIKQKI